jgi:glyoxylase-like metal-dependent hydrolase (beta-lactamase superfamily II)
MGAIMIGRLTLGVCQTNCYFCYRENEVDQNGRIPVVFFDPADRGDYIYEALEKKGFYVMGILLTHGHFDHIMGAERLRERSGAPIFAYEGEQGMCEDAKVNLSQAMGCECVVKVDEYLSDGALLTIAGMECRLIAAPGHTPGGCCYYFEEAGLLVSGDTLFQGSVGRTDFPGGSMGTLVRSIKERLFVLPEEVKVYPGHGDSTEIGIEMRENPFVV